MKKIIQFLMKIYLKRHAYLMSDPGFSNRVLSIQKSRTMSFGDSDYIYVWTSHEITPKVYDAIYGVLEEERMRSVNKIKDFLHYDDAY